MSRSHRGRSSGQQYCVAQETTLGRFIIGRTSYEAGMKKCDLGLFQAVYDDANGGALVGFTLVTAKGWERAKFSDSSPCSIPASEMQVYAGRRFKDGRSQTAKMCELEKLTRVHPKFGFPLPPEDRVELVTAKMEHWKETFSIAAGKVPTRRPRRLAGMNHPIGSLGQRNIPGDVFVVSGVSR
jgi:hypothetical protein